MCKSPSILLIKSVAARLRGTIRRVGRRRLSGNDDHGNLWIFFKVGTPRKGSAPKETKGSAPRIWDIKEHIRPNPQHLGAEATHHGVIDGHIQIHCEYRESSRFQLSFTSSVTATNAHHLQALLTFLNCLYN